MPRIRTHDDIAKGLRALTAIEPRFEPLIALAGDVPLRLSEAGLAGLCRIIVSQQVSVASARAIWGRVERRYPGLEPHDIRDATETDWRACGLSGPKIRTLRAIAIAVSDGNLDLAALEQMAPVDVRKAMTAISGIGPWTADIYMMFHLGHADTFAPGDLALQEAVKIGFGLAKRPTDRQIAAMAEHWSPWRAVAARLLWAYYAQIKAREGLNT
jgi:DNA-3-methyladenine glycosylase II